MTEIEQLKSALEGKNTDQQAIAREVLKWGALLLNKNADYGSSAWKAPILAPECDPATAIRVRMSDKIERMVNLLKNPGSLRSESFLDTARDLGGYCLLLVAKPDAIQQEDIPWEPKPYIFTKADVLKRVITKSGWRGYINKYEHASLFAIEVKFDNGHEYIYTATGKANLGDDEPSLFIDDNSLKFATVANSDEPLYVVRNKIDGRGKHHVYIHEDAIGVTPNLKKALKFTHQQAMDFIKKEEAERRGDKWEAVPA